MIIQSDLMIVGVIKPPPPQQSLCEKTNKQSKGARRQLSFLDSWSPLVELEEAMLEYEVCRLNLSTTTYPNRFANTNCQLMLL